MLESGCRGRCWSQERERRRGQFWENVADRSEDVGNDLGGRGPSMELRLPLEMSPGREAACRAVFGTWGFFRTMHGKTAPSC